MPSNVVLLVEDNPNDEELTCIALNKNALVNNIVVARDGAEALDYLFGRNAYAGRDVGQRPIVVLLDLNLPKLSGMDVLRAIRADERTATLPVVILTSSAEDVDLLDGYKNGANSYVVKPVEYAEFTKAVQQLGLFWMLTNHPPTPPHGGALPT
jgi:two-component system response regulator